jgi:hypothetical protein
MLIQSPFLHTVCEHSEVLVPAVRLLPQAGVQLDCGRKAIKFYHLWLEKHEILFADGAPAESLYVPDGALNPLAHFADSCRHDAPARPILEDKAAVRKLINQTRRHGERLVATGKKRKRESLQGLPKSVNERSNLTHLGGL